MTVQDLVMRLESVVSGLRVHYQETQSRLAVQRGLKDKAATQESLRTVEILGRSLADLNDILTQWRTSAR